MELYFLRHGLAGQHGDPHYKDDSLRPLTLKGRKEIHRAALGMRAQGLAFDLILSSPYLRAKQTAEAVAKVYKIKAQKIHLTENLLPPAKPRQLLKDIKALGPSRHVLCVGHEPHLSVLVSSLLNNEGPLNIDFKKGGLCCLNVEGPVSRPLALLRWLLTPQQLGLMA